MARAIVIVVVALAACGGEGRALREWTLEVGDKITTVTLPSGLFFDLPRREVDYALRTEVPIPIEERGRPFTLVLDCFHGDLALHVDRLSVPDDGDTGVGEHRFVIPGTMTRGSVVRLELRAHQDVMSTFGFAVVPRFVGRPVTEPGPAARFNRTVAIVELALVALFTLLYGVLWILSRRPEDAAFVVISVSAVAGPLWQLGSLVAIFGPFAPTVLMIGACMVNVGIVYFLHFGFELGPVPRRAVGVFATIAVASLFGPLWFEYAHALLIALAFASMVLGIYLGRQLVRVGRARHGPCPAVRRVDARLILTVMIVTSLVILPDAVGILIAKSPIGGVHLIPVGIIAFAVAQAVVLARQHVARQRELELSADELRRQVAERSRELADALAQLASHPPEALVADRVIADRYRVIKKLGAGGMGAVYEVERTSDRERLALKTLRGRAEPDIMARFAREAQIAAETRHDNLVPVLDVGIADGSLFLVMPLVAGGSLEQQRAKFGDAAWATPLLAHIATGLAALHARDIVHRDLKPGNVLIAGGVARIADFGLAALRAGGATAPDAQGDTLASGDALADTASPGPPLTRAGDIFGTPGYMAPELAAGAREVTPAADVFAFGVIAFELATGRAPFVEPPVMARLHGRPIATPSLDAIAEPLRGLVQRCLDVDPAQRPTASDLATELRQRRS